MREILPSETGTAGTEKPALSGGKEPREPGYEREKGKDEEKIESKFSCKKTG
jgi:hypothetical protein